MLFGSGSSLDCTSMISTELTVETYMSQKSGIRSMRLMMGGVPRKMREVLRTSHKHFLVRNRLRRCANHLSSTF